jgi:hypothetical protein
MNQKNESKPVSELTIGQLSNIIMIEVRKEIRKEAKKQLAKSLAASIRSQKSLIKDIPTIVKLAALREKPIKPNQNIMLAALSKEFQKIKEDLAPKAKVKPRSKVVKSLVSSMFSPINKGLSNVKVN